MPETKKIDPHFMLKVILFIGGNFTLFYGLARCFGFNGSYQGCCAAGAAAIFITLVSKSS